MLQKFIVQGFETFSKLKGLSKVTQGLRDQRNRGRSLANILNGVKPDIDNDFLIEENTGWVYFCLNKISSRMGEVPLRLYSAEGSADANVRAPHKVLTQGQTKALFERNPLAFKNGRVRGSSSIVEIVEHPFLELWNNMNSYRDQFEVIEETSQFEQLTGDAYWYVPKTATGIPSEVFLLPANLVEVVPGEGNQWVRAYVFGTGPLSERVIFTDEEIVHFRLPNLKNQYVGMGRLEPSLVSKQLFDEMQAYNLHLNKNSASPSTIIAFKDPNTDEDKLIKFMRIWNRITQGVGNAGNSIAHNGEVSVDVVGLSVKDMMFKDGQLLTRDQILSNFGVPVVLAGGGGEGERSNAEFGHYDFEKNTMKPKFQKWADKLNADVVPLYGEPSLFCAFDENVPEDEKFELDKTTRLSSIGLLSRDEGREREDYGPADPNAIYIVQGGIMATEQGENNDPNTEDNEEEPEETSE